MKYFKKVSGDRVYLSPLNPEDAGRILEIQKEAFQIQGEIYDDFCIPPLVETLEELKVYNNKGVECRNNILFMV